MGDVNRETWAGRLRAAGCALLLTLLGVCGYAGASREEVQTVSVPIARSTLEAQQASHEEIRARLSAQREQELELLESVLTSAQTDGATAKSALSQKEELARRMECEASAEAVLEGMGFAGALSVCGAQVLTVILPQDEAQTEEDRLRAIDAVCAQTGIKAEDVKIILAKK